MTALATQMQHFGLMSAMAQKTDESSEKGDSDLGGANYKALVLCYWDGGNDGNNMVVPNHSDATISNYAAYAAARNTQGLALAQASLLPIAVPRLGGLSYGLHPNLGILTQNGTTIVNNGIHELWAQQRMAIVANVGTLVRPTLKAQMGQSTHPKPYQLYSHSDQTNQAQNANARRPIFTGWGGRIADAMTGSHNPTAVVPMVSSIAGSQVFTAAQQNLPLNLPSANNAGAPNLAGALTPVMSGTNPNERRTAFNQIIAQEITAAENYLRNAALVADKARIANAEFQTATEVTVTFPNTGLGLQLKQVARVIKKRLDINTNRQIFFVRMGGFDTHQNQLGDHVNLFTQFSQAARAFYEEMVVQGIQNNVTLFTLSDFNRTMNPAGSGSGVGTDHAWGNHMFVIGGAVNGGNFYGSTRPDGTGNVYPTLVFNGPDDADGGTGARGRWIPTTSVEQYANTLAKWYGLPQDAATLAAVFPNLVNFTSNDLGFLPPPTPFP